MIKILNNPSPSRTYIYFVNRDGSIFELVTSVQCPLYFNLEYSWNRVVFFHLSPSSIYIPSANYNFPFVLVWMNWTNLLATTKEIAMMHQHTFNMLLLSFFQVTKPPKEFINGKVNSWGAYKCLQVILMKFSSNKENINNKIERQKRDN